MSYSPVQRYSYFSNFSPQNVAPSKRISYFCNLLLLIITF
nr:MAG TPA: hypothetical protein [Caudoviricetes sp.]